MKKIMISIGLLTALSACATTQNTSVAGTSAPKEGTDNVVVVNVLEEEEQADDFGKIEHDYEVAKIDTSLFDMDELNAKVKEINTYMGETGLAYLTDKGIVVSFERGDIFGLSGYVPSNNSQSDYKKLVKALNTFKGTVIIAGKTNFSASGSSEADAHKRAYRVARFISKADIPKERILLDDKGVSFDTTVTRKARVSNSDRVVEFLLLPKRV